MTHELTALLEVYYSDTLRIMATVGGLNVKADTGKPLPKNKVIALMQREFFTRERILASVEKLNKREKIVLNRILLHNGLVSLRTLKRELLAEKIINPTPVPPKQNYYHRETYTGEPQRRTSKTLEDILAQLTYFGLVFNYLSDTPSSQSYKVRWSPSGLLFIPKVIRNFLPPPTSVRKNKQNPTHIHQSSPTQLLRDLYLYWDFVRRTPPKLLKNGYVSKRGLVAIERTLLYSVEDISTFTREDDVPTLLLLRQLLHKLKLVYPSDAQLVIAKEKSGRLPAFWSQSTETQLSRVFEAWKRLLSSAKHMFGESDLPLDFQHAISALLHILQKQASNDWVSIDEIWMTLQNSEANFLFPNRLELESHPPSVYGIRIGHQYYYESQEQLLRTCDRIESGFVNYFLGQIMFTLGMTDIGYFDDETLSPMYRLTAQGQRILKIKTVSPAPISETGKVILQPTFQILAMGPVALSILATLDRFADRQNVDVSAFEYQITRQSIYRAQQADISVDTILQWLADFTEQPVPQNVYRSLLEWGEHHRRIVFRTGVSLLQTTDAALLQQLIDTPKLNERIARTITPNMALLKSKQNDALVKDLRAQNLFATLGNDKPESVDHSILFCADGTIDLIQHVPDLHLRGRLSRYAEEDSAGQWRLTAESVRRGTGNKTKVASVLDDMRRLHRGTLPPELISQVKAWGGYYGDVNIGTLTLIEFQDAEIMLELMTHPELRDVLSPFAADKRALAIVAAKKLKHVKKVLATMGISAKKISMEK